MARSPRNLPPWLSTIWHSMLLPTHRHALGWWIGTRILMFAMWAISGFYTQSDVIYYHESIWSLFHGVPAKDVLVEYPTPLIWLLSIPYILGFGTRVGYVAVFILVAIAGDALMGYVLWRSARQYGTNPRPAAAFWIWFVLASGPIIYMRLDFLTAALSAAGLIAIVRSRRFTSGAMIGAGAAIKLWPALLWPTTMVDKKAIRRASIGFFGTGAALAIASVLYAGWQRLISPLTWQSDRGLQIESVYATPLMLARQFAPHTWTVWDSTFNAFELRGPGTVTATYIATGATILGGLTMLVLYIGWLLRKDRTPIEAGTLMIIATLIMIITNKTFSPQYMIWLAGPVAALLTISARHPELLPSQGHLFSWMSRPTHLAQDEHLVGPLSLARHIAVWTLILTVLTQAIYPLLYSFLTSEQPLTSVAVVILALRNLTLVYFTIRLIVLAFRSIAFRPALPTAPIPAEPVEQ
ncbi:MAG: DUF2029 domain-containing protein [Propionibacteriaceae bacterium]|nr:DUF2029 domain-containing protein [Propionibacteriaceae bacterium]